MEKLIMKQLIKNIAFHSAVLFPFQINISETSARRILTTWSPCPVGNCKAENEVNVQYDLQIIIPAYNVQNYISQCLQSVLYQKTHYRYMVTIVDDGSTDTTSTIIHKFVERKDYSCTVKLITQKNHGLSAARNSGLQKIYGQYVMFVDSDDILQANAVEEMLNIAYKQDADIVQEFR